jgi:hypothetical protein
VAHPRALSYYTKAFFWDLPFAFAFGFSCALGDGCTFKETLFESCIPQATAYN